MESSTALATTSRSHFSRKISTLIQLSAKLHTYTVALFHFIQTPVSVTLAFLGQTAVTLPGLLQMELQGMAVSQLWRSLSPIPLVDEMKRWHQSWVQWRRDLIAKQKVKSTFYTAFVPLGDHLMWLDKTAGTGFFDNFGFFKSRAWSFWWNDKNYTSFVRADFSLL